MERLTTIKSYRIQLNDLCIRLNFKPDSRPIISELIDEKYESCLTTESLERIESLLNEVGRIELNSFILFCSS